MQKRVLLTVVLTAWMAGFIFLSLAQAGPVTIRFSNGAPENHFLTQQYIEWGKLVEKNSGGEIKVQVYHSAQLFRDNEVIKAVQTGALEAGCAYAMYAENQLVPAMKVLMMPFLYKDLDDTLKVYRSEVGAAWKATAEQKGVKLLNLVMFPAPDDEIILTTKPVKVPADVKGTVLRVVGPETAALAKKWGAGASFISGAEVYLALQRGTVHGAFNSLTTYVERKLYEVGPYVIFLPSINVQTFIAVNKGFFDRLELPQQKAILDASAAIEANTRQVAEKTLKEASEEAKKKAKLYTPTAAELNLWREGTSSIWEEMAAKSPDVAAALQKTRAILNR